MARPEQITLDVPAAVGAGKPTHVFRFRDKTVQIGGVFAGTVQLEGTLDGEHFTAIGAALSAPGFVLVPMCIVSLRVQVTALSAGAPIATFGGFDYRAV